MGLFSRLRQPDDRITENRALPAPENEIPYLMPYTASSLTPLQALGIGDVWAAVRCLADAASSLPLHVYRDTGQGRQRVTGGRLVDLLDRPSPSTTQSDMVSTIMAHLLVWGNCYLAKFIQGGQITQIAPLYPDRVTPELTGGRLMWRYSPPSGPQRLLTESDVVHIRGMSVDGVTGLSPVGQAASVLQLSSELVKHALSYFDTGDPVTGTGSGRGVARPAGVLNLGPDATSRQGELEKEQLRNVSRPHGILVVAGEATYTPISGSLDQAQFVEQRRLVAQEIARVFRIPAHLLGAPATDSLTYSTVEQESIEFVRYSLMPWLRRVELAITGDADLAFQSQYVKFEIDSLLRSDAKTRAEYYQLALQGGWMDVNEIRALEDLEPRPTPQIIVPPTIPTPGTPIPTGATNGNG